MYFHVLTQFTDPEGRTTLKSYIDLVGIYAAGRLDYDSEGLLLLTDDGEINESLTNPRHERPKTYWAQVEGKATPESDSNAADGSLCRLPALAGTEVIRTAGGHHFDGDYQALAQRVLDGIEKRAPGAVPPAPSALPEDRPTPAG